MGKVNTIGGVFRKSGLAGLLGVGLALAAVVFYLSVVVPLGEEKTQLQNRLEAFSKPMPRVNEKGNSDDFAQQAQAFYAALPTEKRLPTILRSIFLSAERHAVVIQHGAYDLNGAKQSRLRRYKMTFSTMGLDGSIRDFIDRALNENPGLILEQVTFTKRAIGDAIVQSEVRFGLLFGGLE